MGEWIVFGISALLLITGLFLMLSAVVGQYRFKYVLNRMHAASMGDSMGLGLVLLSLCLASGDGWLIAKYLLVVLFVWLTSPTAGHLIARLEIATDSRYQDEMEMIEK
ncbi:MAG: monovalent cation/H(+) antiporter subunit G [Clostridia bacterium]|nr:monovalent cation/H(+) antiporter subunit G [Clostridia bacterium]